jgi:hypothetical protein
MLRNIKKYKTNQTYVRFQNASTPTDKSIYAVPLDTILENIKDLEISYPTDLKTVIQQLKVPHGSDGVVEFSAFYEQLETVEITPLDS